MGPTLAQILSTGNLKIKVIIPSGETNMEAMETFGNKVVGYKWHATDDVMVVALPIARSAMGALAYVSDSRGKVHIPPEK